jgi:hypothetical protein
MPASSHRSTVHAHFENAVRSAREIMDDLLYGRR